MPALASILPDLEQADGVNRAFDQIDRGCLGDLANPETPEVFARSGDMPVKRDPSSRRMVPFSSAPVTSHDSGSRQMKTAFRRASAYRSPFSCKRSMYLGGKVLSLTRYARTCGQFAGAGAGGVNGSRSATASAPGQLPDVEAGQSGQRLRRRGRTDQQATTRPP